MDPAAAVSRYRYLETLRRGDGIATISACDRESGGRIVIKVSRVVAVSPEEQRLIRSVAASVNGSGCPALIPLSDWGVEKDLFFVISPHVAGISLDAYLAAHGPLSAVETLAVARSLLNALRILHSRALFHLNVRPSKVMILESGAPDFGAALLPRGLTRSSRREQQRNSAPTDQLRYASPEQIGLLNRGVDERSDLYSLGVLLYTCLVGHPPFEDTTVARLVANQAVGSPRAMRSIGLDVPSALDELTQRLMRKEPDDRYQSATAALADVDALLEAITSGQDDPSIALGRFDRRTTLTESSFIGRDLELICLEDRMAALHHGAGGLVLVNGVSGSGKTRLLAELCSRATRRGLAVFQGSRLEPGTQQPLGMLWAVGKQVASVCTRGDDRSSALRSRLLAHGDGLPAMFAPLAGSLAVTPADDATARQPSKTDVIRAISGMLSALGTAEHPAVVVFDDCQWADSLSIEVVTAWARRDRAVNGVLIVVACRSDELPEDHPLHGAVLSDRLDIAPLTSAQVEAIAESSAGRLPAAALEVVKTWSQGNPFMVSSALWGLVEAGALVPEDGGWSFDQSKKSAMRVSDNAAQMLSRRLEALGPEAARLVNAGAVLGGTFDVAIAAPVAGLATASVRQAVVEAQRAKILLAAGDENQYGFVHDRLRETTLDRISTDELRTLHSRAAEELERRGLSSPYQLAHHFDAAGQSERAMEYALPAAREARRQFAFDLAERLYRVALRAGSQIPRSVQRDVAGELGEVLKLTGSYDEATACMTTARALAADPAAAAWAETELGELAMKQGDTGTARTHLAAAIRLYGGRVPAKSLVHGLLVLWELAVQVAHVWGSLRLPRSRKSRARLSTLSRLYDQLAYPMWFERSSLSSLWVQLRQLNLAERGSDRATLARAYAVVGPAVAATLPFMWRWSLHRADRALAIRRSLDDAFGCGQSLGYRATILYAAGRYEEAEADAVAGRQRLERVGDPWEINLCRVHEARCQFRLGRLRESVHTSEDTFAAAMDLGDRHAAGASAEILAKALGKRAPVDLTGLTDPSISGDVQTENAVLQAEAVGLLGEGDIGSAVRVLEWARRRVIGALLLNTYTASTFSWAATAHRRAVEEAPTLGARRISRLRRRAWRSALLALVVALLHRNERPHALREAGLVAALRGRERAARWLLDRSIRHAAEKGALHELAQSKRARADVGAVLSWPDADLDEAESSPLDGRPQSALSISTQVSEPTLQGVALLQRYDALLEAGRRLTSARAPSELAVALCDSAVLLLRAEQCSILSVALDADRPPSMPDLRFEPSSSTDRHLVDEVIRLRRPVLAADSDAHRESGPAGTHSIRSALFAPVVVRGRVVGCLRAVHRSVSGMFGAEELQLAAFLTALAGESLERAALRNELMAGVIRAQEAERARVARDLHDDIGQGLTALLLGLQALEAEQPDAVSSHTVALRSSIGQLLTQVRRLAFELRPAILDDLGLGAALGRLIKVLAEQTQLAVDLDAGALHGLARPRPELESTVYRVAQEALTNVVRHSHATECSVLVTRDDNCLRLIVEDDGTGFDPDLVSSESLGLRGMEERAVLAGGRLAVSSAPDAGTSVALEVPLG